MPYFYFTNYLEYTTILISIGIDILSAIKLSLYFRVNLHNSSKVQFQSLPKDWNESRLSSELWFLIQNIFSAVIFLVTLIPFLIFGIVCKWEDRRCYLTSFQRVIVMLYECYSRRVFWRTIDQLVALIAQIRLYWDEIKKIFRGKTSNNNSIVFLK